MDKIQGTHKPVKIATYNVEELGEGENVSTDDRPKRLQAIANTIQKLDADFIALQEVPSEKSLDSFVKGYLPENMYPYRHFFKTNDPVINHMAVLSRYPITETESNAGRIFQGTEGRDTRFIRDVSETQINIGSYPLRIYNVHFKANPYFPEPHSEEEETKIKKAAGKRLAEAGEVIRILAEDMKKMPSKLYIVAGDMNSHGGDPAAGRLTEKSSPVPLIDSLKDAKGDDAVSRPQSNARMDYILLSPELASMVKPDSAHVFHSEEALKGSDHLPVSLTIELENKPDDKE